MGRSDEKKISKEDMHTVNIHIKKWSSLLKIGDMQIKTTLRYFMPVEIEYIKKSENSQCWWVYREKGTLIH